MKLCNECLHFKISFLCVHFCTSFCFWKNWTHRTCFSSSNGSMTYTVQCDTSIYTKKTYFRRVFISALVDFWKDITRNGKFTQHHKSFLSKVEYVCHMEKETFFHGHNCHYFVQSTTMQNHITIMVINNMNCNFSGTSFFELWI